MDINKVCKRFRNVEVLDINDINRVCHTSHGQHLNKVDKVHISKKNKQNNWQKQKEKPLKCNSLKRLKPGKLIKKTGSIRLQSLQSIETNQRKKLKIVNQNANISETKMNYSQHSYKVLPQIYWQFLNMVLKRMK
jgi:hypothetical protein